MMDFYNAKIQTARKTHKCEMCGQDIKPGEQYSYESGMWDGDFFVRKLHIGCNNILSEYCREIDNEFDYDSITEYWMEHYCANCEHRFPLCKPDSKCGSNTETCPDRRNGKCTAEEPCDIMDRVCWCTKYKEERHE